MLERPWDFTFHLTSGQSFTVRGDRLETVRDQSADEITKYSIEYPKNYDGLKIHSLNLGSIAAITKKRVGWWKS